MRLIATLIGLIILATGVHAAPAVYTCNDGADGNIPQSSGWAPNVTTGNANAITAVPVPAGANRVIMSGFGNYAVCERASRCGGVAFTGNNPNGNGYLLNPNGRYLPTAGGVVSVTAPVTGTIVGFEFCKEI